MRGAIAIVLTFAFCGHAGAVVQGDCAQEQSIYTDTAGVYQLSFKAPDSDASVADLEFRLDSVGQKLTFNGYVMPYEPNVETNAILFHNCPEGDVTGADLAACTVWKGFLHVTPKETIGPIPTSGEQAATDLFFPGLGPSLRKFLTNHEVQDMSSTPDVFSLKGCRS